MIAVFGVLSGKAASLTFQAETGVLGSDWAVSNTASPPYITITTDSTGNNPGSSARVASYTVTFPTNGTYQLYAHVRVGPATFNDDSLFYASSFGIKSPTLNSDWILVNGLGAAGFGNNGDIVTGGGTLGSSVWKWVNLSQFTSQTGFTVDPGNLTQTFQIGARENGLDMDKFVFGTAGYTFAVSNLDNGTDGMPPALPASPTFPMMFTNSLGVSIVAGSNGVYLVNFAAPAWTFMGDLAQGLTNRTLRSGTDRIGAYSEITFTYTNAGPHAGGIRLYNNSPVVLFNDVTLANSPNDLAFPRWINYPLVQSHLSFGNTFSPYNFSTLFDDNLWLFFQTNHDTFIISPATNYMVSSLVMKNDSSISCGINSGITQLPAGFSHRVVLTAQNGINQSYTTWGNALLSLAGKTPPANDSAVELNKLGYWTDNGAAYYYANPPGGIASTLLSVKDEYENKGVPLGYLQLDSWWYQKGNCHCWQGDPGVSWPFNGIYLYQPDPVEFPNDLSGFQQQLGLPLFTHARWIDMTSPYRTNYAMSGNVCVDPAYWTNIMSYLKNSGVVSYEQDWLGVAGIPNMNLTDPPAYLNLMAAAAASNGLNLQYCMVQGRDFLQGSLYPNLLTTRTCPDVFDTNNWTMFIYGSRMAQAMGIWPWSDVFRSAATRNLLLSTLSAGPVGPGDALGTVNATNLSKSVRPDGVIVKPDVPLVPVDDAYVNDALNLKRPFVATTCTDHTNSRALYVFAYGEAASNLVASIKPSTYGITNYAYVYDYFARTGKVLAAGSTHSFTTTMPNGTNGGTFLIVVPFGPSGMAFLGDTNKFVTRGKKRIASFSDNGILQITAAFAAGETNVTLCGYAPTNPVVTVAAGFMNTFTYNQATGLFAVTVSPDNSGIATVQVSVPPLPRTAAIDITKTFQTIEGIGGATAFYAGWLRDHPYKQEIYTNVFAGLNISMLRLGDWYRYQTPLAGFDSAASDIVSNANRLLGHPVPVFMSSWAPPAFLKSNGQVGNGGTLVMTNGGFAYTNFAQYWYDSIEAYKSNGVSLTWLSIQNEPDWAAGYDSCVFHPNEDTVNGTNYASYSKALDAVYQRLTNLPSPPKILAPEVVGLGFNDVQNYAATMHAGSFYGVAHHLYGGSTDDTPDGYRATMTAVTNVFPGKPKFMTEFGYTGMMDTACLLHDCFTWEQAVGFNFWSLVWPVSGGLINHENPYNMSSWTNAPPGMQSHGWWFAPSYWAMKHFSYYIQPGYKRVSATNNDATFRSSAFLSPDGLRLVVVLINTNPVYTFGVNLNLGAFNVDKSSVYQTSGTNYFRPLGALTNIQTLPPLSLTTVVLDQIINVGPAANPMPADGAAGVVLNSALSWTAGSNAVAHAVYLGTDSNAVALATQTSPPYLGTVTNTSFYPPLNGGTTYFWRVDESAGINTNTGTIWSFTTAPTPILLHEYSFDETGGADTADSVGGPAWTGTLPNGGTLSGGQVTLSGSQQYVRLPAGIVSALSNFTALAWIQLASTANWARAFDFGNSTTVYMYLAPQNGATGRVRYAITTSSSGGEQQINCNSTLSTGAWHQLAVTQNGNTGILYVDGLSVGTNSGLTLRPSSLGATANNFVGKSQWSDPYLNGMVDELRLYSVPLSPDEIAATYALGPNQLLSTNSPTVDFVASGASLTMTWPVAMTGYTLQTCTDLAANLWSAVGSAQPQIVGTNYQLVLSATNQIQFYRLSR